MGVALSSKMYVPQGVQVPCVNLAADVDLDDIHPWAADLDTAQKMVSEGTRSFVVLLRGERKAA